MNDFLKTLAPGIDRLGLLRTVPKTCPIHGPYQSRVYGFIDNGTEEVVGETACDACRDEQDRQQITVGFETTRMALMTSDIGIPRKFAQCTLKGFDCQTDAMRTTRDRCVKFVQGEIRSLILCGPTDRGKTHLMAASLKGCVLQGLSAIYVTESTLYRQIKESNSGRKDTPSGSRLIERYSRCKTLGIDEIGRSSWTEYEAMVLGEIITNRSNDELQTILASNLMPGEIHKYFDEAILRKLGAVEIIASWPKWEGGQ